MASVARPPAGPEVRAWAAKHGVSDWMAARWVRLTDDPLPLLAGLVRRPPRYVRVNPLRGDAAGVQRRLSGQGFLLAPTGLDPMVLKVREAPMSTGATLEHLQGRTTPQDLASASAPIALGTRPGERVLDLAAAPGVKTLHLAGDMENSGALVAVEPEEHRIRALRFNLERCGVANTVARHSRGQEVPGEGWADRVLLDAPCTGEGTMPKDRSRRRGRPEEIVRLAALQRELVDAADRALRPGGALVYATCTLGPEENEAQVQRLIDRGYRIEELPFSRCAGRDLEPAVTEWFGERYDDEMTRAVRFLPGLHPTLGFFVARLTKPEAP